MHLSFSSLESMNNDYSVTGENYSSKIDQCTPYLKVPFRIPVKYKVTKAHKIEIPGQIYTQRQLIICFIYT